MPRTGSTPQGKFHSPSPQAMEPCEFHYHVGCSFPSVQGGFRLQSDLNPSYMCWERAVSDFSARICACFLTGKVKAKKKTCISRNGRKRSCVDGISRIHSCNYREQTSSEDDTGCGGSVTSDRNEFLHHLPLTCLTSPGILPSRAA